MVGGHRGESLLGWPVPCQIFAGSSADASASRFARSLVNPIPLCPAAMRRGNGERLVLKLIRHLFAVLSEISSTLSFLKRAASPLGRDAWDEGLIRGLRPSTVAAYKKSLRGFENWMDRHGHDPIFPTEFDTFVVKYARHANLSRSYYERLISAVERFHPCCKHKLFISGSHGTVAPGGPI